MALRGTTFTGSAFGHFPAALSSALHRALQHFLKRIEVGTLTVTLPSGPSIHHRGARPGPEGMLSGGVARARSCGYYWQAILGLHEPIWTTIAAVPTCGRFWSSAQGTRGRETSCCWISRLRAASTASGTRSALTREPEAAATLPHTMTSAMTSTHCGSIAA